MKIVLTEEQERAIVNSQLNEDWSDWFKGGFFDTVRHKLGFGNDDDENTDVKDSNPNDSIRKQEGMPNDDKVRKVYNFIKWSANNHNHSTPEQAVLKAQDVIDVCNRTGFDPYLMLAQAHIESHCGTTPLALKCQNPFSVGLTDSGGRRYYKNGREATEKYADLMQRRYLKGKTANDLMNNFVNDKGQRYASSRDYEKHIRWAYNKAKQMCPGL